MLLADLAGPVDRLRGVGPRVAALLARLGIVTERDLLLHFPRAWQDRTRVGRFADAADGGPVAVRARVVAHARVPLRGRGGPRGGGTLLKITVDDGAGRATLACFNREFLARALPVGADVFLWGVFEEKYGGWQSSSFEYELVGADADGDGADCIAGGEEFGAVVPVYPLTEGLTQKLVRRLVRELLAARRPFPEELPDWLVAKRALVPFDTALAALHRPPDPAAVEPARQALAYAELFLFQAGLLSRRAARLAVDKPQRYGAADPRPRFVASFGHGLTAGQAAALDAIFADLRGPRPMRRLLLGDVGSGKTAVAACAALFAARSGHQAAVAAPTGILAWQLADRLERYLGPLGTTVALLTGKTPRRARTALLARLAAGEVDVLVGTHALFTDDVRFRDLALVIVDEQHRFGVEQRRALAAKGERADYLAMSATPIPRSMAMALYGDCELTRIPDLPAGRPPLVTRLCLGRADEAWRDLAARAARGERAYVVYPLVAETEKSDLAAAETAYAELAKTPLAAHGIALVHGRLDETAKRAALEDFRSGRAAVLVSTTVVEVGVDVPEATAMLVVEAQRFGLSQLHQLRGRVGRGTEPSACWLLAPARPGEDTLRRLEAVVRHRDGFRIAEEDLALRGPGDFFGAAQSGLPRFAAADLVRDADLLERARRDAQVVLDKDPALAAPAHARLRARLAAAAAEDPA